MEIQLLQSNGLLISGKSNQILVGETEASGYEKVRILSYFGQTPASVDKRDDQIILAGPGSYEVGGIEVYGTSVGAGEGTIYIYDVDGVSVAVIPGLDDVLSDKKIEKLEEIGVDVCILTTGKIGQKTLYDMAKRIGANYIVFTTEVVDLENSSSTKLLKVMPDTLPEGSEVVVLQANG